MNTLSIIIDFMYPIIIPIGLAAFAATIALSARRPARMQDLLQMEAGYTTLSEVFEYRYPFWHEFSLTVAFAYVSYDIWAILDVFETHYPVMNTQIIIMSTVFHLFYLSWRLLYGTDRQLTLALLNRISVYLVIFSRSVILCSTCYIY